MNEIHQDLIDQFIRLRQNIENELSLPFHMQQDSDKLQKCTDSLNETAKALENSGFTGDIVRNNVFYGTITAKKEQLRLVK